MPFTMMSWCDDHWTVECFNTMIICAASWMWSDIYQTSYTELAYAYDTHASCQGRALVKVWGPKDEGITPTTSEKTLAHRGYKADITEGEGWGGDTLYGAPQDHPATHGCGSQRTGEFFQGTGQPLPFPWPLLMGSGTPGSRYYTLESTGHHPLTLRRHFSTMHSPLVILLTLMWGTLVFTQKQGKATATLCVTMKAWLGSGLDLGRVPSCVHTLHTVCKHRARWRMLSASGLELLIWIHCSKYNLRLCWTSLSTL